MSEKSVTVAYMSPGDTLTVKIPVSPENSHGLYPNREKYTTDYGNTQIDLLDGFYIEKDTVGTIKATATNDTSIEYTHHKPENNKIWFVGSNNEKVIVDVVSVPIHDHSSIVRGGPAYGTYFSDDEVAE